MKQKTEKNKYIVPALERGIRILELLSACPNGLTMPEMSCLDLPSASLYRMLVTLSELGYIVRDEGDRYRLSRKLLSLACNSMDEHGIAEKAIGLMRELRDRSGETVLLAVLYGNEGIVIDEAVSSQAVKVSVQIGHHFPLHTAAPAKAILAYLPEEERTRLLNSIRFTRFTPHTIPNRESLETELHAIRKCGYSLDRGEELEEIRCAGAPILNHAGYPVAAIWISGPVSRLTPEALLRCGEMVRECAAKISQKFS
mgnify:CR=1 FL=1